MLITQGKCIADQPEQLDTEINEQTAMLPRLVIFYEAIC